MSVLFLIKVEGCYFTFDYLCVYFFSSFECLLENASLKSSLLFISIMLLAIFISFFIAFLVFIICNILCCCYYLTSGVFSRHTAFCCCVKIHIVANTFVIFVTLVFFHSCNQITHDAF